VAARWRAEACRSALRGRCFVFIAAAAAAQQRRANACQTGAEQQQGSWLWDRLAALIAGSFSAGVGFAGVTRAIATTLRASPC
jgi:hypothetical protein